MNAEHTRPSGFGQVTRTDWLKHFDFSCDPFKYDAAEDIPKEDLWFFNDCFVPFNGFARLLEPRTTFLFTEQGCGKSANRVWLAQYCAETLSKPNERPNILPIVHDNFHRVRSDDPLGSHFEAIFRRAVLVLKKVIDDHFPNALDQLSKKEKGYWIWFIYRYPEALTQKDVEEELRRIQGVSLSTGKRLTIGVKALAALLKLLIGGWMGGRWVEGLGEARDTLVELSLQLLRGEKVEPSRYVETDPIELSKRFAAVARAVGIDYIFVLVDGANDELERIVEILSPLFIAGPLWSIFCFKFFLPSEMRSLLQGKARFDRANAVLEFHWDDTLLQKLLHGLLKASSPHESLDEVCVEDLKGRIEIEMVRICNASPRNLMKVGRTLIDEQVALINSNPCGDWRIQEVAWQRTQIKIARYLHSEVACPPTFG